MRCCLNADISGDQRELQLLEKILVNDAARKKSDDIDAGA